MYQNFGQFNPYNPQFQQFQAQMAQQRLGQMQPDGLQFVNGIESAQMFQMPPNSKQILMDSNRARFYLKETDASGMAKVTAYDFTEAHDDAPTNEYVTRQEFESLRSAYESIAAKVQAATADDHLRLHADDDAGIGEVSARADGQ